MPTVTATALMQMLCDDQELALLDVREKRPYSVSHLFYASSCPLSRLERLAPLLVPRRTARVVLCDADEGEATRAAARLGELGYTDIAVLGGGIAAWTAAGYVLFRGVNVPSKAFGEWIESTCDTPSIRAEALAELRDAGADYVILDSRPTREFTNFSIPGGRCCPGAELVRRIYDAAPSPHTTVVVNCAGRTRSIIGAQSLINAGVPNRVVSLRNGTMAWHLAGFALAKGATAHAVQPSPAGAAQAGAAAARIAERFAVRTIDRSVLDRWRAESDDRSLFICDVRTHEEYVAGHLPDARWVAGGQLVQALDQHVGTLRSRIVLVDDDGVRATLTASWLVQMGWRDAVVLAGDGDPALAMALEMGTPAPPLLGVDAAHKVAGLTPAALAASLERGAVEVVDISSSRAYRAGHIPGACHAVRARFKPAFGDRPSASPLVITSDDAEIARIAAAQLATHSRGVSIRVLDGGNRAWSAAGYPLVAAEPRFLGETDDALIPIHQAEGGMEQAMHDYLNWERELNAAVARDGTAAWLHPASGGEPSGDER